MDFWFWFWLITTWACMITVFIILIYISNKEEQRQRREQCMMNHPAGSHAKTEHSHSGQTNHDLTLTEREEREIREKYKGGITYQAILPGSGLGHSSLPHHLEGDK